MAIAKIPSENASNLSVEIVNSGVLEMGTDPCAPFLGKGYLAKKARARVELEIFRRTR